MIAEFSKNSRGETIRVSMAEHEGMAFIDIRLHVSTKDGRSQATSKGITIGANKLADMRQALGKASQQLARLGFFDEGRQ